MASRYPTSEIRHVDIEFARLMSRYAPEISQEATDLIANLSHGLSQQHSCLELEPKNSSLIEELASLAIVGDGTNATPLVLQGEKLYLHRYYQYEKRIAENLIARNQSLGVIPDLAIEMDQYFDPRGGTVDWQKIAALQALTRQLTIITGGPGTGKTSTVVKILAILLAQEDAANFTIRLAAPTGKAAMRLSESIVQFLPQLPETIRGKIPTGVLTIHRLLGMRGDGRGFRHNRDNPIVTDLLIVDEVSMVDLTLMYNLLDALPPETRLIMLGDPEQLPSVEAGNVLADLCRGNPGYSNEFSDQAKEMLNVELHVETLPNQLTDSRCHFHKSYRFSIDRGIGQLANMIRSGDSQLVSSEDDEVQTFSLESLAGDSLRNELMSYYFEYEMLMRDPEIDPMSLLNSFEQTRILCPIRDGELGVESFNVEIEKYLETIGLKNTEQVFYHGRPILITRNDYGLGLFNGDVGVCIQDPTDNQVKAAFLDGSGNIKLYLAARLPPHETCFAMTVHKSQGSEFDHVTLILPRPTSQASEQLLTRELIYTATTRARNSIAVYTDEDIWTGALLRTGHRMSGLASFIESTEETDEQLDLF